MFPDYLIDINPNDVKRVFGLKFTNYIHKEIDGVDYICCCGDYITDHEKYIDGFKYSTFRPLIDILNIGYFIHNEITKDFQNVFVHIHNGKLKKDPLYNSLIKKLIAFCLEYGNYEELKRIEDKKHISVFDSNNKRIAGFSHNNDDFSDHEKEEISEYEKNGCYIKYHSKIDLKMKVNTFLYHASKLYLLYRDFQEDADYIHENAWSLRLMDLNAKAHITPIISKDKKGNRKMSLSYDFYDVFDLAKYQFLLSQMGTGEKKMGLCAYCNTFFESDRKKIYCSTSHANMMSANKKSKISEKVKHCKTCENPFEPEHQKQKYCSEKCKRKADNQRAKESANK